PRNCRILKVNEYITRLEHSGITNASQEVIWLMSEALGMTHSEILTCENLSGDELARLEEFISRRENGEPLQYILGNSEFYGYDFHVGPGVLIPRHDTESIIDAVKNYFAPDEKFCFLDWGTGSGCIAITLLLEFPESFAFMLDVSPQALDYSRKNLEHYELSGRARIITSLDEIDSQIELLVSNPPYIPSGEIAGLMKTVKDYEPLIALDGGSDGMRFYREIFAQSNSLLKHNGYIILEAGDLNQVQALKNLSRDFVFRREFFDSGNFPRALVFQFQSEGVMIL
ncbi:MAG: peptide chain release factor N(5)-glutamine methyltransferase, partial [Synergistaceae bacterium]|nr:peptide chain release factor N(5)-glutamine methyltransferase [Synergistaceae bacterium]